MTAEKLHDAISLLPADLVAETDKIRQRKPGVMRWKRYAAMAASFALVASCAWFASIVLTPRGATETAVKYISAPAAAAPMEQAAEEPAWEEAAPEEEAGNSVSGGGAAAEDTVSEAAPKESGELRMDTTAEAADMAAYSMETPLKPSTACFSSASQVTLVTSREELDAYLTDKDWIYDFTEVREVCTAFDGAWFEEKDLLLIAKLCVPVGAECSVTSVTEQDGIWQICISYDLLPEATETTEWHILLELEKGKIPNKEAVLLIYE